jgi:spore maturation protein CgeB
LVYLGGRWDYKAQTIDEYLLPLLRSGRRTYALAGWGGWPADVICKKVNDESEVAGFYASGRVAPCISEPHTQAWGIDLPERCFKAVICGVLAVHDAVSALRKYSDAFVISENPGDFRNLIEAYLDDADRRRQVWELQYADVTARHTYFDRMANLLASLGFHDESTATLNAKAAYV